jgi:DNA-binding MarR family transcriptional regulator
MPSFCLYLILLKYQETLHMDESEVLSGQLRRLTQQVMHRSMHGLIHFSHEKNLSMSQVASLFRIRKTGSCGVGEIASHLGVSNAAASQLLDRLVQQGLVARSEDPADRRGKVLVLTESGNRILQESMEARQGWVADLSSAFSPEESRNVASALDLLAQKMEDSDPPCTGHGQKHQRNMKP